MKLVLSSSSSVSAEGHQPFTISKVSRQVGKPDSKRKQKVLQRHIQACLPPLVSRVGPGLPWFPSWPPALLPSAPWDCGISRCCPRNGLDRTGVLKLGQVGVLSVPRVSRGPGLPADLSAFVFRETGRACRCWLAPAGQCTVQCERQGRGDGGLHSTWLRAMHLSPPGSWATTDREDGLRL